MERPKRPKSTALSLRLEPTAAQVLESVCRHTGWSQAAAVARALHTYKAHIGRPKPDRPPALANEHRIFWGASELHALNVKHDQEKGALYKKVRTQQGLDKPKDAR